MAANSKIEWTDHTFNPWRGCTKVAEGCKHCYAETLSHRNPGTLGIWGPNGSRVVASEAMWREPLKWDREAARSGVRARVFCASLADVFEDWQGRITTTEKFDGGVSGAVAWWRNDIGVCRAGQTTVDHSRGERLATLDDVRAKLFKLIDKTPHLDWLLLTKRPENIRRMWPVHGIGDFHAADDVQTWSHYRPNVWLGTSISTQADADTNIPELLKCRDLVPVLFVSAEPLLAPVDLALGRWVRLSGLIRGDWPVWHSTQAPAGIYRANLNRHGAISVAATDGKMLGVKPDECEPLSLDLIICGGESGPNARPMHPDWARSLRDQCQAANVPYFFKQWGEWMPVFHGIDPNKGDPTCRIKECRSFGDGAQMWKVGKKAAGRTLDGREWNEFPTPGENHA